MLQNALQRCLQVLGTPAHLPYDIIGASAKGAGGGSKGEGWRSEAGGSSPRSELRGKLSQEPARCRAHRLFSWPPQEAPRPWRAAGAAGGGSAELESSGRGIAGAGARCGLRPPAALSAFFPYTLGCLLSHGHSSITPPPKQSCPQSTHTQIRAHTHAHTHFLIAKKDGGK